MSTYKFKYDGTCDPCTEYVLSDLTLEENQAVDVQAMIVARELPTGVMQRVLLLSNKGAVFPIPWAVAAAAPAAAASKQAKPGKVASKKTAAKKVAPQKIAPKKKTSPKR